MNKKELVGAIVDKTGFTKKDLEALALLREKQESAEIQESQNSLLRFLLPRLLYLKPEEDLKKRLTDKFNMYL